MAFRITRIPQTFRNIQRLREIVTVLWKYGFGDITARLGIEGGYELVRRVGPTAARYGGIGLGVGLAVGLALLPFTTGWLAPGLAMLAGWVAGGIAGVVVAFVRPPEVQYLGLSTEERIRLALQELGPTFVKFGQVLATRPDLIPMSLIDELKRLQDEVPPFEAEEARRIIEDDLGVHMEEVFFDLERAPLAAASIAQVHRGTLRTGEEVVCKIQRPGIQDRIDTDLDILRVLAEMAEETLPEIRRFAPVDMVEEFRKSITLEIDFTNEAHNIDRFARNFAEDPEVKVPKVFQDLSSERVLTMEYIDGIKPTVREIERHPEIDRERIAKIGIRFTLEQTFVHGFFHADPHPGNIFVLEDNRICLVDYGMMGSLDQERIDELLVFLVAILTQDTHRMIRLFLKLDLIDESVDLRELRSDIDALIERYWSVEIASIDVARYIQKLFDVVTRHDIQLPADLLLMGKALGTIDGVARDIYPELDPVQAIRPYILKIYARRLADPRFYLRDYIRAAEEGLLLLQSMPRDIRRIVTRLEEGSFTVRTEDANATLELRERNRAVNRMAMSVVIGALVLGGAYLTVHGKTLPEVAEYPISQWAGLGGILLAGVYSLGLLWGVIRTGGQ